MKVIKWIGIVLIALVLLFFGLSLTVGTKPQKGFMSSRINEIESYLPHRLALNTEISSSNVAWQLDHSLKAIINITQALEDSSPEQYSLNFNFSRTIIFTAGDFLRGVAQAPASVMPPDTITMEALTNQIDLAKEKLMIIQELPDKSSMHHDTFGLLDRNEAARLIEVHTDHHLKIIQDILSSEGIESSN